MRIDVLSQALAFRVEAIFLLLLFLWCDDDGAPQNWIMRSFGCHDESLRLAKSDKLRDSYQLVEKSAVIAGTQEGTTVVGATSRDCARATETAQHLGVLWRVQDSWQTISDSGVKAAMLFAHGDAIMPRDFVDMHRDFDYRAIQGAEGIEELVKLTGWDVAAGAPLSQALCIWLGHRIASLR